MLKQGYNAADGAFRFAISLQRKRPVAPNLLVTNKSYNFHRYKEHYGRENLMKLRDGGELGNAACKAEPYDMGTFRSSINNQIQYTMLLSHIISLFAEKTRNEQKIDAEYFDYYVSNIKRAVYWAPIPFGDDGTIKYAAEWKKTFVAKYEKNDERMAFVRKIRENVTSLNHLANKFYYYQNNEDADSMRKLAGQESLPSILPLLEMYGKDREQVFHILRHATYFLQKII
ncbi:MAG: hypothetical protein WCT52_02850 [Candidatus Micrarchaeia archaeon]